MPGWNNSDDWDRDCGDEADLPSASIDPDDEDEPDEDDEDEEDEEDEDDEDDDADEADEDDDDDEDEESEEDDLDVSEEESEDDAAEESEEDESGDEESEDELSEEDDDGAGAADSAIGYDDDLEDEFANFIDEELGYAEIDWDTLPEKAVDEHERILAMSPEDLDGLDLADLDDFERWAAARAYLAHGDEMAFETAALPLLSSTEKSPALDYVDIALALMSRKARRDDFDGAFSLLEKLEEVSGGDDLLVKRFHGILTIQKGDAEEGLELLAQLAETRPNDPAFLLSLGEDLCGIGLWEEAVEYLEIAEELAREQADQDLLSSIENAVQFAQRQLGFDDVEDF